MGGDKSGLAIHHPKQGDPNAPFKVVVYRNCFTIDNGPPFDKDEPNAVEFLKDIREGVAPKMLEKLHRARLLTLNM